MSATQQILKARVYIGKNSSMHGTH